MNQETGQCKINNYAVFDNTVTELCFCKGVENYVHRIREEGVQGAPQPFI